VLLFNVFGQVCRLFFVCGYCLLDSGFRSAIVCCLIGNWMNVFYAVFAHCLFFFPRVNSHRHVHESALTSLWGFMWSFCVGYTALYCCVCAQHAIIVCPGSVRVTFYMGRVILFRPHFWFVYSPICRDVSPGQYSR
jgi:hypothetical protein